jgi:hypothetical protein
MEYVNFDFRPIGHDLIGHNLICSGYHHHHHHQSILFKMKKQASLAQLKADLQEGRKVYFTPVSHLVIQTLQELIDLGN